MSDAAVVGLTLAVALFGALAGDALLEWANRPEKELDQ